MRLAGVSGPITREDAEDLAAMMVAMRRAIPAHQWADVLVDRAKAQALENLF